MLVYVIMGVTYGFAAAVQPGPFQAYIITRALGIGWRRTLPAVFAPLISDGPIAALALLVLSRIPPWLQHSLHVAGGLFVLYLAAGALKAWRNYDEAASGLVQRGRRNVLEAALVNLLNPAPYLGWSLVLGPLLLEGWRENPANGIGLLGGFYGAMIASSGGIIILFAAARNLGASVNRTLLGASGIALACFGFYQLWLGTVAH